VVLSAREVDNNYQPDIHYHSFVRDALHYALHPPERNAPRKAQLVLAPGDLGAKSQGGAYNGSIIKKGAEFLGLFRAEAFAEGQPRNNTSATPMLVTFDVAFNVQSVNALNHLGSFGPLRVEDFRLLRSPRGDLLVNHPVVTPYQRTHQFLSRVEFASLELVRWLRPKPDIPLQAQEKNWVYWYHQQELMLLYSLSPFRVLKQTGGDDFVTVCSEQVDYPWTHRGFMSCSTNPVSFDDEHYVLFFHDRDRQRVYRQGAVLLSKRDLRPVYCSTREFFAGEENFGLRPGIIYTMSCTPVDSRFLLCHGEGDSCTSINWLSMDEITSSMTRVT